MTRIISWNVQGLRTNVSAQGLADALLKYEPSVVALHEFSAKPFGGTLAGVLAGEGFEQHAPPTRSSPFRSVMFARPGAHLVPPPFPLPADDPFWIGLRFGELGISAAHIPLKGPDRMAYWDAGLSLTKSVGDGLHLLIGDLNTTLHGIDEKHSAVPGEHYLQQLETERWVEAWRCQHPGTDAMEYSWHYPKPPHNGFRLDQAWVSPSLVPLLADARMDHEVRKSGLSDHSMLIVDLNL